MASRLWVFCPRVDWLPALEPLLAALSLAANGLPSRAVCARAWRRREAWRGDAREEIPKLLDVAWRGRR